MKAAMKFAMKFYVVEYDYSVLLSEPCAIRVGKGCAGLSVLAV